MKRMTALVFALALLLQSTACACAAEGGRTQENISDGVSRQVSSGSPESSLPESREISLAAPGGNAFADVPSGIWYEEAVLHLREKGLVYGTSDTAFSPDGFMTRAMLATVLYRAAGSPEVTGGSGFTDLRPGAYYTDSVSWAARHQIVAGFGGGRFGPEESVTREQAAAILWRHAGSPQAKSSEVFADASSISGWAKEAVSWAREQGIVSGRGQNRFAPKAPVTRGEVCVMLYRYLEPETAPPGPSADETEGRFDLETKTVLLNSGYEMPVLGLGTWTQDDETAANSVYEAIKNGYRLIDTAQYYGNEAGVGEGVRKAIDEGFVTRGEIFITTKVMPGNYDRAYASIDDSLQRLGMDYIDLMLIHQSGSGDREVYRALEQGVKDGKLRSMGISNYYTKAEFDRITEGAEIMPAVIQNENHIFYQNTELQEYVSRFGTVVESYYPFGGRGHTRDSMNHAEIRRIAGIHGKTGAQIILRWHLQAGYIAIPGSSNPDHIAENFDVFDFSLSDSEMQAIASLNTGNRYESW